MRLTVAQQAVDMPAGAEILAGGTDVSERVRSGIGRRDLVDITRLPGLDSIVGAGAEATTIGALVSVQRVGADERIATGYPALAAPARTLATPQIRAAATLGGALCQRTRCWYYRHPHLHCFKDGGDGCPARSGDNHYGVAFDLGPCAYPHPSSVALGLLAYDATFATTQRTGVPIADLYGDGRDPTRDHLLADGELLRSVTLPPPTAGEGSSYVRVMGRKWAEWPLVECVVRLVFDEAAGTIVEARVCLGAVANIPLRVPMVETRLLGRRRDDGAALAAAAERAVQGADPPEQTRYKLPLVVAAVLEAVEQAATPRPPSPPRLSTQ